MAPKRGFFRWRAFRAIVCGPGDIQQAHKANEFVALEQLAACERFLGKFIHSMSVDAHRIESARPGIKSNPVNHAWTKSN